MTVTDTLPKIPPYHELARLDAPGVLHHVMGKGIERNKIFIASKDRHDFKTRLGRLGEEDAMAPLTVKCLLEPQTRNR
ncbi:MAG: hypothetical protein JSW12_01535 [Deltaproteobacteria bacterium]|nr:MAG: hypothetical protein JSW12_01535 [Deltaproteobacteria bacterium]